MITKVLNRIGIEATFVDTSDPEAVKKAISPETKAVYIESPTNPLLKMTDLKAISHITKRSQHLDDCG